MPMVADRLAGGGDRQRRVPTIRRRLVLPVSTGRRVLLARPVVIGPDEPAGQYQVESIAQRPIRLGEAEVETGDQPVARGRLRHRVEHRVEGEQRIAREIHLRHQACREIRAADGKMDVRRPPGVAMVLPSVCAGADGDEPVAALGIGEDAAGAVKLGVERRVVPILRVVVAAGGVGLPDLDHGTRHRLAVLVRHGARHDDPLANRRRARDQGEVGDGREALRREAGAGRLRHGQRQRQRRPSGVSLGGGVVGRRVVRRLRSRTDRSKWRRVGHCRSFPRS